MMILVTNYIFDRNNHAVQTPDGRWIFLKFYIQFVRLLQGFFGKRFDVSV